MRTHREAAPWQWRSLVAPAAHSSASAQNRFHKLSLPRGRNHADSMKRVGIGEIAAGRGVLTLRTVLGSCISVCLYDPVARIGGMNHILVPGSTSSSCGTRCGSQAMESLIRAVIGFGGDRSRLVAKMFGGANVLPIAKTPTIGELNAKFVHEYLSAEQIPLVGKRIGGAKAIEVVFHAGNGKVQLRIIEGSRLPAVVDEETVYYLMCPEKRREAIKNLKQFTKGPACHARSDQSSDRR